MHRLTEARRPRKRPGTLLIAGVCSLVVAVAGCGSGDDGSSGGANGQVTIKLSMQQADVEHTDPATWSIVQDFMAKNPDIKVDVEGQPVDQHTQQMVIAAQSDTLPDIFWIPDATAKQMVGTKDLLDLNPMLQAAGLKSKFAASTLSAYNDGTSQYGVPYEALITGFFYNKAILQAHGVKVPETIDDLLGLCRTISGAGITPISKGANQSSFSVWSFLGMLSRFGYEQKYKDILAGNASYDNPDFRRFYQHIDDMRNAGCFATNVATQTYQQAMDSFTGGKAAMFDAGVFASAQIDKSKVAKDVGFWVGPTFSDGVGDQHILINVPSVPLVASAKLKSNQKKYDAVQKFFAYFYSDAGQQHYVDNGKPPVTTLSPKVDAAKQPAFAAALEAGSTPGWKSPAGQPDLVVPTAVGNAMYDSIYGVIERALSPEQAVQLVDKAFKSAK